jgi:hypothetical protein
MVVNRSISAVRSYLEVVHEVLELLAEAGDDGRAGAVSGGARAAAGHLARGGVGAVELLELALDGLGAAEHLLDVLVHAGAEGLDGAGVVRRLGLLVGGLEALEHALQPFHVLLHGLHFLEELVQVHHALAAGLHVARRRRRARVRILLERVRREEVVHGGDDAGNRSAQQCVGADDRTTDSIDRRVSERDRSMNYGTARLKEWQWLAALDGYMHGVQEISSRQEVEGIKGRPPSPLGDSPPNCGKGSCMHALSWSWVSLVSCSGHFNGRWRESSFLTCK